MFETILIILWFVIGFFGGIIIIQSLEDIKLKDSAWYSLEFWEIITFALLTSFIGLVAWIYAFISTDFLSNINKRVFKS